MEKNQLNAGEKGKIPNHRHLKHGLVLVIIILSIGIYGNRYIVKSNLDNEIFTYGMGNCIFEMDPLQNLDSSAMSIVSQVCEGLFEYQFSDNEIGIIPCLAESMGSWNAPGNQYTVSLKPNLVFQDGSDCDAHDVKWTFDRLLGFISRYQTEFRDLYQPMKEQYPFTPTVLESVLVMDELTVKFILNYPFGAFPALLCHTSAVILSSTSTPKFSLLDTEEDVLVGTGPYQIVNQSLTSVTLSSFDSWHGELPENRISHIEYRYIPSEITKNQLFLDRELDGIDSVLSLFISDFSDSASHVIEDAQITPSMSYIGINNERINHTLRQAISYSFNYDHYISSTQSGEAIRLRSPIPAGIRYHRSNLNIPDLDFEHARQILIAANLTPVEAATHISDYEWWSSLSQDHPIAILNYTLNLNDQTDSIVFNMLQTSLEYIGIRVNSLSLTSWEYATKIEEQSDTLQIFYVSEDVETYNDPYSYIYPKFSSTSDANILRVNDSYLDEKIYLSVQETFDTRRQQLYYEIQEYLVEDVMPCLWLSQPQAFNVHGIHVTGFDENPMQKIQFKTMMWTDNLQEYRAGTSAPSQYSNEEENELSQVLYWTFLGAGTTVVIIAGIWMDISSNYRKEEIYPDSTKEYST